MTESEEKFRMIVKSSIEQAKEIWKMRISKDNIENITERIFVNVSNHIKEHYGENDSQ